MSLSRRISFISAASSPPCAAPAHINMHVIGAGVPRCVDAKASNELGMFELHYLYGQTYHSGVNRGDSAVAVGIDGYVRGVAVLVLAIAGRAANAAIVLRGAETGVNIDVDVGNRLVSMPTRDFLNHQLQLVQQLWIDSGVTGPDSNLVVVHEVTDFEVPGDRKLDVGRIYLEESFGRRSLAAHTFGQVGPDPVATHHPLLLFREGHQHRQGQSFHPPSLTTFEQTQVVKARFGWRRDFVATERLRSGGEASVANAGPGVLQRSGVAVHIEGVGYLLGGHGEGELDLTAGAEGAHRWLGDRNYRAGDEGTDRAISSVVGGLQELERSDCGDSSDGEPHHSRCMSFANREIIRQLQLFAGRMSPSLAYDCGLQASINRCRRESQPRPSGKGARYPRCACGRSRGSRTARSIPGDRCHGCRSRRRARGGGYRGHPCICVR